LRIITAAEEPHQAKRPLRPLTQHDTPKEHATEQRRVAQHRQRDATRLAKPAQPRPEPRAAAIAHSRRDAGSKCRSHWPRGHFRVGE
jgi:hypothetical protein